MRYKLLVSLLFSPFILFSQEIKFSNTIGYAVTETEDVKKIALCTGINAGFELPLKKGLYITISAGGFLLRFNYNSAANNSVFNSKYFFSMPVSLKKYYPVSRQSRAYWCFGIFPGYQFYDKKEIRSFSGNSTETKRSLGFNFGCIASVGFKTIINSRMSFDIGLLAQTDYFFSYKKKQDKTKTDQRLLSLSLHRKLRK